MCPFAAGGNGSCRQVRDRLAGSQLVHDDLAAGAAEATIAADGDRHGEATRVGIAAIAAAAADRLSEDADCADLVRDHRTGVEDLDEVRVTTRTAPAADREQPAAATAVTAAAAD